MARLFWESDTLNRISDFDCLEVVLKVIFWRLYLLCYMSNLKFIILNLCRKLSLNKSTLFSCVQETLAF